MIKQISILMSSTGPSQDDLRYHPFKAFMDINRVMDVF